MQRRNADGLSRFQLGFPNLASKDEQVEDQARQTKSNPTAKSFAITSSNFFASNHDRRTKGDSNGNDEHPLPPQTRSRKKRPLTRLSDLICPSNELALIKAGRTSAKAPASKDSLSSMAKRALQHITPNKSPVNLSERVEKENAGVNPVSNSTGILKPTNQWMGPLFEKPIDPTRKRAVSRCRLVDLYELHSPMREPTIRPSSHKTPAANLTSILPQSCANASTRDHHTHKRLKPTPLDTTKTLGPSDLSRRNAPESPCPAPKAPPKPFETLMSYSKDLLERANGSASSDAGGKRKRKQVPLSELLPKPVHASDQPRPQYQHLALPPPPVVVAQPTSLVDISPIRKTPRGRAGQSGSNEEGSSWASRARALVKAEKTNWEMWRSDAQRTDGQSCRAHPSKLLTVIANPKLESQTHCRSMIVEGEDEMGKKWTLLLSLINSAVVGAQVGNGTAGAPGPVTTTSAELVGHYRLGACIRVYQPWYVVRESVLVCGRFRVESAPAS
ncbi:hypothetical protein CROQUDRAFT_661812 [Cronartium quercuum f. sp. fusiforme G11]|uniref:Uncharacterized protein n=1 Tax=Cronartium quercuum f. sp. fusiforme G11 TaxID=708437 RepID=A0A9P6NAI7_9BASI|nr:hypothetical protein CROQUDRAFT_661812 [Cronartium quercuum f. sp. fusiforme G11]